MLHLKIILLGVLFIFARQAAGQENISFEEYDPVSSLKVEENVKLRAKFPFVDIHNHQSDMPTQNLNELLTQMDSLNMTVMVNLSGRAFGGSQEEGTAHLRASLENIRKTGAKRLVVFTNLTFDGFGESDWTEQATKQLENDVKMGAMGLKIFKNLGFDGIKDTDGKRVAVNDPRIGPVWDKCGELGIPVLIHTADPPQFWQPMDKHNERWLELKTHPRRKRGDNDPEPFEKLIAEQHDVFRKHPKTTFIAAHFGWYASDLKKLDSLMTVFPNIYVEFGAVIAELGRQPKAAQAFFEKWQDKILFGKDSWVPAEYATYFRVLETNDEYFPYHKKYHAFWRMYGLGLPDNILRKIYYKNALRLLPKVDKSLFPKD